MARDIGTSLKTYNMNNGLFTDYYDSQAASKDVTLSYVMPDALAVLKKNGIIDEDTEQRNANVLYSAPLKMAFCRRHTARRRRNTHMIVKSTRLISFTLLGICRKGMKKHLF